jgi:ubiquinone/menaquinone biosynthesis C-methylase UbiE
MVAAHYSADKGEGLGQAILDALTADGADIDNLTLKDLAPIDAFHIGGWEATERMARALGLAAGMKIADLGSGLGGTARQLAVTLGCHVSGVDLTGEYCRVATMLAGRLGLLDRVSFHEANALDTPFPDAGFDAGYTQHAAMNIADKAGLYAEAARILKPGAAFCIYDIAKGPGGPVIFPAPWARDPAASFLATMDELLEALRGAGFTIENARDHSEEARDIYRQRVAAMEGKEPPRLGFHIMLGPVYREMTRNQMRNFNEDRVALVEIVCRKD